MDSERRGMFYLRQLGVSNQFRQADCFVFVSRNCFCLPDAALIVSPGNKAAWYLIPSRS